MSIIDPNSPGLFSFFAPKAGQPSTYAGMQARRQIALALLANSKKGYPRTIGEGLTAIGDAIGDRAVMNQLYGQESEYAKAAAAAAQGSIPAEAQTSSSTGSSSYAPTDTPVVPATPAATPPAATPPAPAATGSVPVVDPNELNPLDAQAGKPPGPVSAAPVSGDSPLAYLAQYGGHASVLRDGKIVSVPPDTAGAYGAVHPELAARLAAAGRAYQQETGKPPKYGEMSRGPDVQSIYYNRYVSGQGGIAAPPGRSHHQSGTAADLPSGDFLNWLYAGNNKDRFGLHFPVRNDSGHTEMNPRFKGSLSAASNAGRDAVAASLMPNPAASAAPPDQALQFTGVPADQQGLPPEITGGRSAIRPAPPDPASQIQPMPQQVAQNAPPGVPPTIPKAPLTGLPQRPVPNAPDRMPMPDDVPMTDDEKRGWRMRATGSAMGDVSIQSQGQALIDKGVKDRNQQYEALVRTYQDRVQQPQRELERQQRELELAKGKAFGGVDQAVLFQPIQKSAESVAGLPAAQTSIRQARDLADNMFTGTTAPTQLTLKKMLASAGFPVDPKISGTEDFQAAIKRIMTGLRPALVGNANISDADIRLVEGAAGGDIRMEKKSITDILGALERLNVGAAVGHQRKLEAVAGDDPQRQSVLFGAYGLPMEGIVPRAAVDLLKSQPTPEVIDQFNKKYRTPGLAQRILGGG